MGGYAAVPSHAASPRTKGFSMATGLELYEALKEHIDEEAARMMAEAFPLTEEVATKTYLDTRLGIMEARLDARLSAMEARTFRWMLGFFATLWVSNAGVIVTLVLKS